MLHAIRPPFCSPAAAATPRCALLPQMCFKLPKSPHPSTQCRMAPCKNVSQQGKKTCRARALKGAWPARLGAWPPRSFKKGRGLNGEGAWPSQSPAVPGMERALRGGVAKTESGVWEAAHALRKGVTGQNRRSGGVVCAARGRGQARPQ